MNNEIAKDALYGMKGEGWKFLFELSEDRNWGHGDLNRYIILNNGDIYTLVDGGCSCNWTFTDNADPKTKDWTLIDGIKVQIPTLEKLDKDQTLVITEKARLLLGLDFINPIKGDSVEVDRRELNKWLIENDIEGTVKNINRLYKKRLMKYLDVESIDESLKMSIFNDWTSSYDFPELSFKSKYELTSDVMLAKELYNQASMELDNVEEYDSMQMKQIDRYLDFVLIPA